MKGEIVDVHPVAPPLQKKRRLLTQKTVLGRARQTDSKKEGELQGLKKRNDMI